MTPEQIKAAFAELDMKMIELKAKVDEAEKAGGPGGRGPTYDFEDDLQSDDLTRGFEVEWASKTTVRVYRGAWTRNRVRCVSPGDGSQYTTVSVTDSGYIIAELDDPVNPTSLTVSFSTTWSFGADVTNASTASMRLLAEVSMANGRIYTITRHQFGDIGPDFYWPPDKQHYDDNGTETDQESLELAGDNSLQIHGFDAPEVISMDGMTEAQKAEYEIMLRHDDGSAQKVKYLSLADLAASVTPANWWYAYGSTTDYTPSDTEPAAGGTYSLQAGAIWVTILAAPPDDYSGSATLIAKHFQKCLPLE